MYTKLIGLSAIAICTHLQAQDRGRVVAKGEIGKTLDAVVERYGGLGFSGAVLVAKEGKVLIARGIGHADLAGKKENTANTLFELASVTKQFTGAALCKLQEQGKLDLDDSIARHLPNIPENCRGITIRHLLNHTSGIPGTNSRGAGDDLSAVIPVFLEGGPKHDPGTHWEYWNQGYSLLSAIIERRSHMSYASYCRKKLFKAAGMKTARFTGDKAPRGASVAVGRSKRGEPRGALDHPYGSYGYQYRGMGGAVANVWDLWRWHKALQGEKVLKESAKRELFDPKLNEYALGWYVRRKKGRIVQSHGGAVRGFVCDVRRFPEQNGCVFVLANDDGAPVWGLAEALENALFGEEYALPPAVLDKDLQARLVGSYKDKKGRSLIISIDAALTRARIVWGSGSKAPVSNVLIGMDGKMLVFFQSGRNTKMSLVRDKEGVVVSVCFLEMQFDRDPN